MDTRVYSTAGKFPFLSGGGECRKFIMFNPLSRFSTKPVEFRLFDHDESLAFEFETLQANHMT